ncbi:probable disease resistance protein At4g27220 [Cornus florida]|uniref:probable disease resistance protein At4g27220 n=1 Tax=Cornus florida TaxID=4283 RepID=UPI002897B9EB|nr:probable disease resistance protein At4g27220 [Cornus florida]XP_059661424.1 probable disease resistance protein At4g27220 [Cornus florida]
MFLLSKFGCCDDEMQTLISKIKLLSSRQTDVIAMLQDAEFRTRKKRKREVENWLDEVQKKMNEFKSLEQDVQRTNSIFQNPPLKKRAEKMINEVTELVEQGRFPEGLVLNVHDTKVAPLLTENLVGQQFEQILKNVMNCLTRDDIKRIGIYGMGGSGKTTLATHVHNLLLQNSGRVHWLTVSQDWSIDKLQNDIANILGLDHLSRENERKRRAAKISEAILKIKNKFVLIWDDVWEKFSLQDVGIPESMDGCKLIFTTRLQDVCHKMGCQEKIEVRPLSDYEAWELFVAKLVPEGIEVPWQKNPQIKEIAMSMAEKCGGLPLGIITMGGSMRGVDDTREWRNALEELEVSMMRQKDMGAEVFPILRFSYSRLRDELQCCFLYCVLYHEDCKIEREGLIEKFIANGLIDKRKTRRSQFDKGHTMLSELENACLLENCRDGYGRRCVKMHDLMREMALEIARCRCMVKVAVYLEEMPDEKEWKEDLESISLMHNSIKEIPTGMSPRCPELSTLLLNNNSGLKQIPYSFFTQMSALRVLDLSYTGIVDLPSNVSDLENLTALFLTGCKELRYVPPLGKLGALQLLDLTGTCIEEVPQGMDMEVIKSSLKVLPRGMLAELSSLQVLRTGLQIKVRGVELERLGRLEEFEGRLCSMSDFNGFVKSNVCRQLNICRLHVGNFEGYKDEPCKYGIVVKFRNCSLKNEGEGGLLELPHNIQYLEIDGCHHISSSCDVPPSLIKNAKDLKECGIYDSDGIECILSQVEEEFPSCGPLLQSLEILRLYHLPKLSGLIKYSSRGGVTATPPPGTLSNLKVLRIESCGKMKKLFTPRLLQHLLNLETIDVSCCYGMEEIIGDDEDELMGASNNHLSSSFSSIFSLPKLRHLRLFFLGELESICRGFMACDSLEVISIMDCGKLKRLPFSLPLVNGQPSPLISLKNINITGRQEGWWESLEWDHPNAKDILQPFISYSW